MRSRTPISDYYRFKESKNLSNSKIEIENKVTVSKGLKKAKTN